MRSRSGSPSSWRLALVVFIVLATLAIGQSSRADVSRREGEFSRELIYCQEAVAKIESCCGARSELGCSDIYSHDDGRGCSGTSEPSTRRLLPDITVENAECILASGCDGLGAKGICKWSAKNAPSTWSCR